MRGWLVNSYAKAALMAARVWLVKQYSATNNVLRRFAKIAYLTLSGPPRFQPAKRSPESSAPALVARFRTLKPKPNSKLV